MGADALSVAVQHQLGELLLDVDHRFEATGTTAIVGSSGAGKTSLLRCIAGLDRAAVGRISCGSDLWQDSTRSFVQPVHARRCGLVFQQSNLFSHLSVRGNLEYAIARVPPAAPVRVERAEVIDTLELEPLLERAVDRLSGGEQRRVALARALLSQPRWLLLDEPLSGLDLRRRRQILGYLELLQRRFAIPTLLVSHQLDEVARLASSVLVLQRGAVLAAGPAATVLQSLDAELHTDGSVLEGALAAVDERWHLATVLVGDEPLLVPLVRPDAGLSPVGPVVPSAAGLSSVPRPGAAPVAVGDPVRLYVRAEDVAIALDRPARLSIRNALDAIIETLQAPTDSPFAHLTLRLDGTSPEQRLRVRITRAAAEALQLAVGQSVVAMIKAVSFDVVP